MPQVSIVIVTYNANSEKLCRTLHAAATQKEIDFEIIIADDGSAHKDFSFVEGFLRNRGIRAYQIIENPYNQGTVKNCISGVKAAKGEYVFLTSPGDFLYDEYVLRDFYSFAKEHDAKMCFGNPVFYSIEGTQPHLTKRECVPVDPLLYSPKSSLLQEKVSFLSNFWVIGASYFREREFALKYLEMVSHAVTYLEDCSTTAFALADGYKLYYNDRNIIWYEDGTGISTSANEKWAHLIAQDTENFLRKLIKMHPRDGFACVLHCNYLVTDRLKRIGYKLLRHPLILLYAKWVKKHVKTRYVQCSEADLEHLNYLLAQTVQGS